MDLLKILAQRVFLPLSRKREGFGVVPIFNELQRTQYLPPEQLKELQWERLRNLLREAYDNVPYYGKLMAEHGLTPDDIRDFSDFRRLPCLTKSDIRRHKDEMLSKRFKNENLVPKKTGGSTGVPLHLLWDREATAAKQAATMRHDGWAGYAPGEKFARIWGADVGSDSFRARLYNALVTRCLALDALSMDEKSIREFAEGLRRKRPKHLFGHAHSLYVLARNFENMNITDLSIESIVSTAEVLTEGEREKIEAVFGAKVFDRYGCEELSMVASECEHHEGLHINAEQLYLELGAAAAGEPRDIIITDLTNYAMPFIRYQVEDMSEFIEEPCPCGRTLPRLKKLFGRQADFLYTPDGKMLSGISIMDHFAIDIPGVWQVQVVQDNIDHLHFRIIKTEEFGEQSHAAMAETVPRFFGPGMKYDIEFVEELERTPRGKYKFSICEIDKPN